MRVAECAKYIKTKEAAVIFEALEGGSEIREGAEEKTIIYRHLPAAL